MTHPWSTGASHDSRSRHCGRKTAHSYTPTYGAGAASCHAASAASGVSTIVARLLTEFG